VAARIAEGNDVILFIGNLHSCDDIRRFRAAGQGQARAARKRTLR
jgi:hypothetical protein